MTSPSPACPDCGSLLGTGPYRRCPQCRLPLSGNDAAALWQVTMALLALDEHRSALVRQRDGLLAGLRARRDVPDEPSAWAVAAPAGRAVPTEMSGRSAQTALLVLGGILVSVAALVFTVVSWGYLGIGGRAAVLFALTACALTLPRPLRRRRLTSTAEAAAAVGLGLVLLDCYAARAAGLAGLATTGTSGYWAAVTALVALGALLYGWTQHLRFPLAVGFLLTRFPAPLALLSAGVTNLQAYATALVGAAAVDCALLYAADRTAASPARAAAAPEPAGATVGRPTGAGTRPHPEAGTLVDGSRAAGGHADEVRPADVPRGADAVGAQVRPGEGRPSAARPRRNGLWQGAAGLAVIWALTGGGLAVVGSLLAHQPAQAALAFVPLGALALLGLAVAVRLPRLPYAARRLAAAGAGTALLLATGGTLRPALAVAWAPVAYGSPAALLLVAAAVLLHRESRPSAAPAGLFHAAALGMALTSLAAAPMLVQAILEPLNHARSAWAGASEPAWTWHISAAALTGLGLLTAALAAVAALRVARLPTAVLEAAAAATAVPTLALLPPALGLPYGVAIASALLLTVLAAVAVAVSTPVRPAAWAALLSATLLALLWASADRTASIAALAVCALLGAAVTRTTIGNTELPALAPTAAAFTVLAVGTEAAAVGATLGLSLPATMLSVLAVAIASAPVAALMSRPSAPNLRAVSQSVESTGYALAAVALLLTAPYLGSLCFALAVSGSAALGVALRADRRPAAALTATALFICSSWIRLALWEVHTPEAYTLTVAAAALTAGHLRHRRDPAASSWATYGPGLSLAAVPSVLALWADGHWLRPLLLGAAALAVTLLGVGRRLRAPLVLGGAVLLLTAVHEFAPAVVQVLGLLPRWVPLATAGLLLLALGATYEQRLRDARRLRDGLRRLR